MSNDDPSDRTIIRPRGGLPGGPLPGAAPPPPPAPPPRQAYVPPVPAAPPPSSANIGEFLGNGRNPLVLAASPLLLLAAQLRNTASQPDVPHLYQQVVQQVRQFESRAQAAGLTPQMITAARYALCAMLDESVLNTPWGEHGGWAAKTLLTTFHGETYGGEKFFLILDRLGQDFAKHLDLIELMYLCLALGFGGRYAIEPGGRARLADIQEDLYRRIKPIRGQAADELSPHWKGIEDRRNPLIRYVPLWVIAAAGACLALAAFLYFYTQLNSRAAPLNAQLALIGLETAQPADAPRPSAPRKSLKQLLAPQEQAGAVVVEESADGRALVRLVSAEMFPSGGVKVGDSQIPVLNAVRDALNQVPGRVIVVGHTDDQPVNSLRYKDNYELSAERARAVVAILSQGLDSPGRLESSGAGPSQPIAMPPGLPANRARNRRVDIIHTP
ncbi:type IVB secretion system protein IcmH/DotU [Nevskia sp.]|uniref:type IVB secretion system protein IcmH/DotU n=1 Tax=Nevskia sp. TaxID=1929292 RepID=UPI0025ED2BEF|nr:type IVB secretion system protein IcmH/DotU [Nevskia sp.]